MPEQKDFGVEHSALEKDIERLSAEIGKKSGEKVSLETQKEILRSAIGSRIYREPKEIDLSAEKEIPASAEAPSAGASSALPSYAQDLSADFKLRIEKLIDLAWHKGISSAVAEARRSGVFILDAFHDALTDKLYDEFKKRKLIK
ncbi:MAG: hypothetical protein A2745_02155 [Candidatus Harrisonbacteria bacterium RIFCSPHIGHO2_01_FULL_44_13]|nr:MAG: hypothetical protein A2745_02155 [Candidatus Harrisonbacteria bacterium RIFCSPHIGHO2_01_FULL_44_13]